MNAQAIIIIADDEQAKHVLLNAGILHLFDPVITGARALGSTAIWHYILSEPGSHHLAAFFHFDRTDGDNGYCVILADASLISGPEFEHFVNETAHDLGAVELRRLENEAIERDLAPRLCRQ
jgi:hypothetical protein